MGEIIAILVLSLLVLYFGYINHRDRDYFLITISDMQNKLMAKSLSHYAHAKSKIDQPPDHPVTSEERLAGVELRIESEDLFPVSG